MNFSTKPEFNWPVVACTSAILIFVSHFAAAAEDFEQCGKASWYKLGGKTASGERADPNGLTAAHRTLPFGTMVNVTNLSNGRTVTVRINDRGPFTKGRVIDVTLAAAKELGFVGKGITRVRVTGKDDQIDAGHREKCQ
ncbi:septal ring lytic transglycosylase RlpA family protein [Roseibium sp. SCP14]|uniref:septal ring lytic transglycosylase RlpA family protein n=1 Tax=Roseibium sp. SCP14 TaxID=3141375 RepID=UPI00333C195C